MAWGSQIWGIQDKVKREQHRQVKFKSRRRGFGCIFVKLCNFNFKSKFGRFLVKFWLRIVVFSVILMYGVECKDSMPRQDFCEAWDTILWFLGLLG